MANTQIPILVAPRPVRLSAPFFAPDRLPFNVPESRSRASSRSALSSEALDEFLNILAPSFVHKPRSLTIRPFTPEHNNNNTNNIHQRLDLDSRDDNHLSDSPKPDIHPPHLNTDVRWFSSVLLASPVSRIHTRNPFPRHHGESPPAPAPPLTPASVPLPSPTPDEINGNL